MVLRVPGEAVLAREWRNRGIPDGPRASDSKNGVPIGLHCALAVVTFVGFGPDIAAKLRALPPGGTPGSEAGWQQGFM